MKTQSSSWLGWNCRVSVNSGRGSWIYAISSINKPVIGRSVKHWLVQCAAPTVLMLLMFTGRYDACRPPASRRGLADDMSALNQSSVNLSSGGSVQILITPHHHGFHCLRHSLDNCPGCQSWCWVRVGQHPCCALANWCQQLLLASTGTHWSVGVKAVVTPRKSYKPLIPTARQSSIPRL